MTVTKVRVGRTVHPAATDDYLELIKRFPLRTIRSKQDHALAGKLLDELVGMDPLTAGQQDYLDGLVRFVRDYESTAFRVNLADLDLLRQGQRLPLLVPLPEGDYHAFVTRSAFYNDCEVYSWTVRDPLPAIAVPIKAGQPDVPLSLQEAFNEVNENERYAEMLTYEDKTLLGKLPETDRDWVTTWIFRLPLGFFLPHRTFVAMDQLKVGVIGGSGLGQLLGEHGGGTRHEVHTPFGPPSDAIIEAEWAGVPVFLLARHGPGHLLNPSQVPYRANIFALKELGCTHILASGAVGSLREEFKPRDLVLPEQVIDKTYHRAGTFYENAAVHVEFSEPFCPVLHQMVMEAAKPENKESKMEDGGSNAATFNPQSPILNPPYAVHARGCYVAMEGPAFSTRAESLMHRLLGGDLIGMTAMPEAKLAREAEISYALIALVTDFDSWKQKPAVNPAAEPVDPDLLLKEIIGNLQTASANAMDLIRRTIDLLGSKREIALAAPSRQALRLAIWSDKSKIAPEAISKLKPLWGRYFDNA